MFFVNKQKTVMVGKLQWNTRNEALQDLLLLENILPYNTSMSWIIFL